MQYGLKPAIFAVGCRSLAVLTETLVIAKSRNRADKAATVEKARILLVHETRSCRALTTHINRLFLRISHKVIYTDLTGLGELRSVFDLVRICTPPGRE